MSLIKSMKNYQQQLEEVRQLAETGALNENVALQRRGRGKLKSLGTILIPGIVFSAFIYFAKNIILTKIF